MITIQCTYNEMKKRYTFVNPPKTGGNACEKYFDTYYKEHVKAVGHFNCCNNSNNPIVVIRDVVDRFISTYKYWKYGAIDTIFKRNSEFMKKYKNYTIQDFVVLLQNDCIDDLHQTFTFDDHFKQQTDWISDVGYSNLIVIIYEHDLTNKLEQLTTLLGINDPSAKLDKINITKGADEDIQLTEDDHAFIKKYYADDFALIDTIRQHPELFISVI